MSLTGMDFPTALSSVATAMGGVGPGLADVGPFDNFLWVHPVGKLVLTFCMLGRPARARHAHADLHAGLLAAVGSTQLGRE